MSGNGIVNVYGDKYRQKVSSRGIDIASQRADDLDGLAIDLVKELVGRGERPVALDAACGLGGQAIRLAQAGAQVTALDSADLGSDVAQLARAAGVEKSIAFVRADLRTICEVFPDRFYDLICCQRAIHYLRWDDAVSVVRQFANLLHPEGKLYLSASGVNSELGEGYTAKSSTIPERYAPLGQAMAMKHGIEGNVCLYDTDDLNNLFLSAGLNVDDVFTSSFGNIKGIASRRTCLL